MKKKYKVKTCSKGYVSYREEEVIGTLSELAKKFRSYLGGVAPRKPETLQKRLNDYSKRNETIYTYTVFYVEEVND